MVQFNMKLAITYPSCTPTTNHAIFNRAIRLQIIFKKIFYYKKAPTPLESAQRMERHLPWKVFASHITNGQRYTTRCSYTSVLVVHKESIALYPQPHSFVSSSQVLVYLKRYHYERDTNKHN